MGALLTFLIALHDSSPDVSREEVEKAKEGSCGETSKTDGEGEDA